MYEFFAVMLMPNNSNENMFRKESEILDRFKKIQKSNIYDFDELMNEYLIIGNNYSKLLRQTKKLVSISDRTQKELFETREKLQQQYNYINSELNRAANHVKSLLQSPFSERNISIDWRFIPSSKLGGDIFGYQFANEKNLIIYVIDVCGHGIGSALHSVSVFNTIRFQTLPNTDFTDPSQVINSLNSTFSMFDHNYLYFTMWYCVLNLETGILKYSGAGHPPLLLFKSDNTVEEIVSTNPPVGSAPEMEFSSNEIQLIKTNKLYLYTDGVYEIKDKYGKYMEFNHFKEFLKTYHSNDGTNLDNILDFALKYSHNSSLEDDFTLIELKYG